MKIKNRKKFVKMISIILFVIMFFCFYFVNTSLSKGTIKTKTIYVSSGDTLWTIANEQQEKNSYYYNKDVRFIIYEIKKLNNLENSSKLTVGQQLIINCI